MEPVNRYKRCTFCENKRNALSLCTDKNNNEVVCEKWDCFYLDADKVVQEAKRLGVGVTDVLAMLDAAIRLNGKFEQSPHKPSILSRFSDENYEDI